MRFVRPARLSRTNYWINSANNPEVPDPRYETGGKPLTNNVIGRRRLIDVGAKQQNSIGKIVPFLLHRFLDWILLLLLRQSPPVEGHAYADDDAGGVAQAEDIHGINRK